MSQLTKEENFNDSYPCPMCKRIHAIRDCTRFLVLNVIDRRERVINLKLCGNCLAQSHSERRHCTSETKCRFCKYHHNSLLHHIQPGSTWVQMTAMVRLYPTGDDWCRQVRIAINPNQRSSSITLEAAERYHCVIQKGYTTVTLQHRLYDREPISVRCVVEDTRYGRTPGVPLDDAWTTHHPVVSRSNIADPNWHTPNNFHVILGTQSISSILKGGAMGRAGQTLVQHSIFGPVFFGECKKLVEPQHAEKAKKE